MQISVILDSMILNSGLLSKLNKSEKELCEKSLATIWGGVALFILDSKCVPMMLGFLT